LGEVNTFLVSLAVVLVLMMVNERGSVFRKSSSRGMMLEHTVDQCVFFLPHMADPFLECFTELRIIGIAALIMVRQPHRGHAPSDSEVVITGACGDTMSLRFSVVRGRIAGTSLKSKGCAYSFICLQAAADAARGRTPLQILDIDADFIARKVGHLPQDHQHCAKLALTTLHAAVDRYMQQQLSPGNSTEI